MFVPITTHVLYLQGVLAVHVHVLRGAVRGADPQGVDQVEREPRHRQLRGDLHAGVAGQNNLFSRDKNKVLASIESTIISGIKMPEY